MTFSIAMSRLGVIQVSVAGELDAATVPNLVPSLRRLTAQQPSQVTVDLSRLRMIDTNGVGALVKLYKKVEGGGGAVFFCGLREQPLILFRLLRLDRLMADGDDSLFQP